MKRTGFMLAVMVAAAIFPLQAQNRAPLIVFESQTRDFGRVFEGETLKHVFKFINKGTATLEILKTEAG